MLIRANKEKVEFLESIDMAELCIVSEIVLEKNLSKEIVCITKKAKGIKCPVCWKISKVPCKKHSY